MEINIFLSYSHANKYLREKLELEIPKYCRGSVNVITDDHATRGKALHKEISKLMNSCHIVIPIITKEWLNSAETRDELVRAHERRKFIICFLCSEHFDSIDHLPFYLRDALRIHFNDKDLGRKIRELCDSIGSFEFGWKRDVFDNIRVIGDYLDEYENQETYKIEHLTEAIKKARQEISQIVHKNEFKRRVSYEDNFIRTALPYYRTAKQITAISIADVSTFWDDPDAYESVNNYLELQSSPEQNVIRLFVLSDPVKTNYFKNILQANYRAYGKNGGGVFICNLEGYKKILDDISRDRSFLRLVEGRDFGLLSYGTNKSEHLISAMLDTQELIFEKQVPNEGMYSSFNSFQSYLQSLLRISEGQMGTEQPCLRWSNDFYKSTDKFAEGLKQLFPDEYGPILHLVMIKANKQNFEDVKDCLHQLKTTFEKEKEQLNMESIWVRERKEILAHDGRFLGRLVTNKTYDFVLGLEFVNEKALQNYYQHKMHSIERERFYTILDPRTVDKFSNLMSLQNKRGSETKMEEIYQEIESIIKKHITRLDVRLHEKIEHIVKLKGHKFGSKYNK